MFGRCDAKAVHQVRQMERSPSTLDLLWAGLRGAVRRRPALRTRGVAHASDGPSSSMCAVQATLALARKVRVALLFLESNMEFSGIVSIRGTQRNPTANGPPRKEGSPGLDPARIVLSCAGWFSMRAHRVSVRMAARAFVCARVQAWPPVSLVHPSGSIGLARGCVCARVSVCSGWSCS
jgi:hypothetical protein